MSGELILISGPVRSGKSDYAENLAKQLTVEQTLDISQVVAYIATAQPFDEEMEDRIRIHKAQRPANWLTFEAAFEPWLDIRKAYQAGHRIFLLDCLTMLVTNWLHRYMPNPNSEQIVATEIQAKIEKLIEELVTTIKSLAGATLIIVTNEVGWGLVPDYPLGRLYRDLSGRCNKIVAKDANQVWLVVMGIPMQLK